MARLGKKVAVVAAALAWIVTATGVQAGGGGVKLYTLNCGDVDMLDLDLFSREGKYKGETNEAADACFLIKHAKGTLMWDTGIPQSIADVEGGVTSGKFHLALKRKITDQLADIGVKPEDVDYLSVSHSHFDHVGNAGLFAASTFLVTEAEHAHMFSDTARANTQVFPAYSALENAKTEKFSGEHDVFGDGTVVITELSGHTPGHTVLSLKLDNAGAVMLTGDLYHLPRARTLRTVPRFNTDPEETLKSMDKFEVMAKKTGARVVIQHGKADFEAMPKFPAYLD